MMCVSGDVQLLAHRDLLGAGEVPGDLPRDAAQRVHHQAMSHPQDLLPVGGMGVDCEPLPEALGMGYRRTTSSHSLRLLSD